LARDVENVGEKLWWEKLRERDLEDIGVDGRIILKWILNGTGSRELDSCGSL